MRTGQYDGVSASGNATAKLVDGGDVAPVNTDLVPNYKTIFDDLKDQPYNTFDGSHYGIPHGRGANLLMWNSNDVKPDPTSWSVMLDPAQAAKYKGKISVYDDPIYIADAAVYLKAHQPDLGITTRTSWTTTSSTRPSTCSSSSIRTSASTGPTAAKQINSFTNGDDRGRHDVAVPVLRPAGRQAAGGGARAEHRVRARRRARRDGRTPG